MSEFNLTLVAGESREIDVTLTDNNGVAIDVAAAYIEFVMALPTPVTKTSLALGGITITDGLAGKFTIALTQDDTVDLTVGYRVRIECKAALVGGDVVQAFYGLAAISTTLIAEIP